jgi:hypothetical protein
MPIVDERGGAPDPDQPRVVDDEDASHALSLAQSRLVMTA